MVTEVLQQLATAEGVGFNAYDRSGLQLLAATMRDLASRGSLTATRAAVEGVLADFANDADLNPAVRQRFASGLSLARLLILDLTDGSAQTVIGERLAGMRALATSAELLLAQGSGEVVRDQAAEAEAQAADLAIIRAARPEVERDILDVALEEGVGAAATQLAGEAGDALQNAADKVTGAAKGFTVGIVIAAGAAVLAGVVALVAAFSGKGSSS